MSKFPDFIIIGSMKCGTTAVWRNMNKHPEITMCNNPEDPKKTSTEIRFWTDSAPYHNFRKGISWYKNLFNGKCCGEKDADLIRSEKAMKLISEYIPEVKLILLVRNPVDRAYSEYKMSTGGNIDKFSQIMRGKKKGYWGRGQYFERIQKHVLPFFSSNQLFVSVCDWMKKDTNVELNKIYSFLGVDNIELPTRKIEFKKRDGKVKEYRNWDSKYKPLRGIVRDELLQEYKEENEKLFDFLGYTIDEWRE